MGMDMKKCDQRRGSVHEGYKSHFEHDCREHVTTEGGEISGWEWRDSCSRLGIKHKKEMGLQRWEFRGEALEAPQRVH